MPKNMELIQITWCILITKYYSGSAVTVNIYWHLKIFYLLMEIIDYKQETSLTYPIM